MTRAATVLLFWPILSRTEDPLEWRDGVLLVWGGLRGVVGVALALAVHLDPEIEDRGQGFKWVVGRIGRL